jgi:cyclohexyl-isocyanide hydratase
MAMHLGMLLFPRLTLLDLMGPFEIFHRIPGATVHLLWKDTRPVYGDAGVGILPTVRLAESPRLDLLFVPGGAGMNDLIADDEVLEFLREQSAHARYVTSVCTGALLLGAAGLLRGYRATTHWAYLDLLALAGAIPVDERIVVDRNRVTAGGVTAGIDFGLRIFAEIAGEAAAKREQLLIEYDPAPPFRAGHPRVADPEDVATLRRALSDNFEARRDRLTRAVQRWPS